MDDRMLRRIGLAALTAFLLGGLVASGADAAPTDTDHDALPNTWERTWSHTDPTKADTDGDGIGDAFELAGGTDPTNPDSDHDGNLDGATTFTDTDKDGLSDDLERLLHTDPRSLDSDGDGFADGLEYQAHFDPADPLSNPLATPALAVPTGLTSGGMTSAGLSPTGADLASDPLSGHGSLDDLGAS